MLSEIVQLSSMVKIGGIVDPESFVAIGRRLYALRKAVGATQVQMTAIIGAGPGNSAWANYERGSHRISLNHGVELCKRYGQYGVTLDWIYRGIALPNALSEDIKCQLRLLERRRD